MSSGTAKDDGEVHLIQTLLKVQEVFVYRVPPLKTSGGHRAEEWDLANPLKTCELLVERLDDVCFLKLYSEKPAKLGHPAERTLFAQSIIRLSDSSRKLEYFVESVVDSSRYFCVKIEDEKTGRTALIGVGFRERDDATNFRMALQDYERSLKRQRQAEELHKEYESTHDEVENAADAAATEAAQAAVSNLSLKEGEKIHVNIKGKTNKREKPPIAPGGTSGGGVPLLLKKPPPPAPVAGPLSSISSTDPNYAQFQVSLEDMEKNKTVPSVAAGSEVGSECAVADSEFAGDTDTLLTADDLEVDDDDDEDDWGDFASSTPNAKSDQDTNAKTEE